MNGNITFTMIKPGAVADGHIGAIMAKIAEGGFKFKAVKMFRLSKEQAEAFYAVHSARPFFNSLVASMSSGPIIAAVLENENAVLAYRDFIGATNPADAKVRKPANKIDFLIVLYDYKFQCTKVAY